MWPRLGLVHSAFMLAGLHLFGVLDSPGVLAYPGLLGWLELLGLLAALCLLASLLITVARVACCTLPARFAIDYVTSLLAFAQSFWLVTTLG